MISDLVGEMCVRKLWEKQCYGHVVGAYEVMGVDR